MKAKLLVPALAIVLSVAFVSAAAPTIKDCPTIMNGGGWVCQYLPFVCAIG